MITNEHFVNIYAPNDETVTLVAYQWVTYEADAVNLSIYPDAKWTAGCGEEIETHLTLTVKDNLHAIRYLFSILEDENSLTKILDDDDDWTLEEYDAWHGTWDDFAGDNAPAIIQKWAQSLPEYEDGMPETDEDTDK